MDYMIKDAQGNRTVSLDAKLMHEGELFLTGEITSESAMLLHKQIIALRSDGVTKAKVWISSVGGDVAAALHIIDIIRETDMAISLIVCDKAYSAAAMILAAGQKGRRFCMQHSRIMIHEISTQINGQYSSIRNLSENVMLTNRIVNELMAKSTGKKVKEIEEAVSYDHFMTAEAAVEFGIVDSIVELSDLYKKRRLL